MRLRKPSLAQALLLGSFLGAFGFLDFYLALHVTELAAACVVALFLWLLLSARLDIRGWLLASFSVLGMALFMFFYAFVFTARTDAALLPSVLAQRDYVFFLIAPITVMLYRSGWRLTDFQGIFVLAVVLATMSRILVDLAPPTASAPSPFVPPPREFLIFKQDTAYPGYSFLLRRLDASALLSALYFGRGLLRSKSPVSFGLHLVVTALSVMLLGINAPRTLLAATLLALLLYGLFLARPGRAKLLIVLLPLLASITALLVARLGNVLPQIFGGDLSYETRVQSTRIAQESVAQYPVFGFGQESAQSVTYQDVFGAHFYPSDLGLLGVVFQWGLLGLLLYVAFTVWLVVNLLKLLWAYTGNAGKIESREQLFLWVLFILCLTFAVTSPIQARFTKTEGLTIAAFSVGLIASHRHALKNGYRVGARKSAPPAAEVRAAHRT